MKNKHPLKVLVPIDDSNVSQNVVTSLCQRKWPNQVEFRIVTVVPYIANEPEVTRGTFPYPAERPYAMEETKTRSMLNYYGETVINEVLAELRANIRHAQIDGKVLVGGVVSSIVQEALEWETDLIVIGSRQRGGLFRFMSGGTAEAVSKKVSCQVEVIRT